MHDDEVIDSKSVKRNEEEKKSIARGGNLTKAEDLSGALQLLCCSECGSSEGDNKWPNISDLLGRKDEKKRLRGENIAKVYEANILLLKSQWGELGYSLKFSFTINIYYTLCFNGHVGHRRMDTVFPFLHPIRILACIQILMSHNTVSGKD